jgi:hypothetical protein
MTKPYILRNKINFAGTTDEDGDLNVTAESGTIFMTRKEMRELRDHLDAMLQTPKSGSGVGIGTKVRIIGSGHGDLLGQVGTVEHIMASGNVQVAVGNESVILSPDWVEAVK